MAKLTPANNVEKVTNKKPQVGTETTVLKI